MVKSGMARASLALILASALAACAATTAAPVSTAPPTAGQANPALWPAARSPAAITDPATERMIDTLIARMPVEQKVGQLIQADIGSITPADLAAYPLGSILAGGNSGPYGNERADAASWARLVGEFREASRKSGSGIPILFGVDAVHGHSNLPGATIFPHNVGLGAANDVALIERIGAAAAAEIAGSGIEWTFAPTLAAPQDVRWGRTYEGFSADPVQIAAYGRAMTLGLQGPLRSGQPLAADKVAATAKHFLADGGTQDGRDQGDARIAEAELIARHAPGYVTSIDAGALTVMASFSSWNGVKHHGNASLLTGVLKQRMGFEGLVVGDWNGHGQVPGCSATDCPASINAGVDLLMAPDSWKGLYDSTLKAAKDGRITAARLDDAVRRILRVKAKLGLMGPAPVRRGDLAQVGAPAHLALAREAVAKSLVLLKNNGGVLPLKPGVKVLITGPGADSMAMQAGGWTVTWQGTDTTAADFPNGQTIGRALADAVRAGGGQATLAPQGTGADKPDVAVVVLGEAPYAEFEGDLPNLAFTADSETASRIAQLKSQGTKVVVVFLSGRPRFTGALMNQADAFVAAWLPGTQGNGLADVLVARKDGRAARDFTGRLPFAWPDDARSPVAAPLFQAGYGLTYAKAAELGAVNADPRMALQPDSAASTFLLRGKAPAPWHFAMDGAITARPVDLGAQEDARQFSWTGASVLGIEGAPTSLAPALASNRDLLLDWRIDRAAGPVALTLGGGRIDLSALIAAAPQGRAVTTRIPLRCFAAAGAKLDSVGAPFRLEAPAGFVATLRSVTVIDGTGGACPPAR
ncbi:beta-glucosidase [Novosphingobium kunmingense]|uniref:Beta-glucosidase n=2 Tax=Novosphingobium kunmingense TaxID=1211806 RepID=A0A2N0H6C5_9SPHN|nr:beta-glucosidase [Novosphingobium kunmingense]